MSERDEFTDTSPITAVEDREGAGGRGPDEDPDEFVVRKRWLREGKIDYDNSTRLTKKTCSTNKTPAH